ncbi:hypothetical protein ONS95_010601 [Cadophora gregata]|uniref:uncharacterized protein n=1 Tax=Cadophora gregata TaxID=51156 RepID=UPI0026DB07A2|nr:uncharacterized protein ONS95_010601 [Cadophora gregata]KAK0122360.1 hypothetical protein ONS95_010601 [Cadophora gregata]KAK0127838.1 hypothetical protein ONS96_007340 [Cadophora gregata f. sp. sojae]
MSESIPNERIFNPTQYFLGPNRAQALEQPSDIIHHILHRDRHTGLSRLAFNNFKAKKRADRTFRIDGSSLVIAVDGVIHPPSRPQNPNQSQPISPICQNSVVSRARASYGIFFGPSSLHNRSAFVPIGKTTLSREAGILRGCYDALDYILKTIFPTHNPRILQTIILTDSPYLVQCLTEYVYIWERNGYRDSRGQYVENSEELANLASMVLQFERAGVRVGFWLVEGEWNTDARRLASEAVDEVEMVGESGLRCAEVEILDAKGLEGDREALVLELERAFKQYLTSEDFSLKIHKF